MSGINFSQIWTFMLSLFTQYEVDQAEIKAGAVATTSPYVIGSADGKPLYARAQLCTDKTFPGG